MATYFTIGEISKFFNISLKTLRYYDEIGLLKPAYVNEENRYRYYSIEQFVIIDLIKQFKATGMSLDIIKGILGSKNSMEFILENIKTQSNKLEDKIQELTTIKNYLDDLDKEISQNIEYGLEKVFIIHNKERKYINYDVISSNIQELDLNLRDVILDLEKKGDEVYIKLGCTVSYEDLKNNQKVVYKGFKAFTKKNYNISYLPEGDYITIIFEGGLYESIKYYNILLDYIKENNIKVVGDFNETWILSKMDENLKEKSLVKIDILKK